MQQCSVTKYTKVRYDYCFLFGCHSKRQNWVSYLLNTTGILLHANSFLYFFSLKICSAYAKEVRKFICLGEFFNVIKSYPTLLVLFDMFEFICRCYSLPKARPSLQSHGR